MSKPETIETEVRKLPTEEAMQLQDWLASYLEDEAELNPEFVASIERGQADLRELRSATGAKSIALDRFLSAGGRT
jgi:hypothetical protein